MATVVVFASSLFVTLSLVSLKALELNSGKKNFVLKLISKLDNGTEKLVSILKFKILQLIQSVRYIVLVEAKKVISDLFYDTQERILNEYRIKQDIMMGRKEVLNKGSVSFYLKKIAENKGNGEKGKIE
ncbi:MAG: hypothetical protein A3A96_02585 [Candidatus Zambryskibacteria bacterium RIFCSPLOWO2_01_FULL_39_39]|uniref:Uncharacterized protein n=1 Tax=Candidatus Zambryskibacteria bacterium RIFCSPLOWO2_01_FULL_39_39 TaxID=1802758 RepID=A0A1G2U1I5_9BACT|nr:MAG: hypothetical protein A2644_02300 [Candidatus Zambryskibacteria bacterium RIFCSPHIGHO2_01_FULL_39_63]OHA94837.1 MAG: hypothetical protein A3B88_04345 [Candidatus Zambryskibacteria bacterium RIFCSPHIGHO2_02_FULL_39_19]OHA98327.1 MAG: hypothetical protein A3F20_02035 [Candidatus Zambryskibacteria bacterium RIFCSPHIGHO2_12_FULL_39_21]OHB02712.1 MAG: hypothetical protein A3A96_02585 [Candidatus Zambryskibacteria bacterium RIFCSPLOWO2_01_FULL_39_39]